MPYASCRNAPIVVRRPMTQADIILFRIAEELVLEELLAELLEEELKIA